MFDAETLYAKTLTLINERIEEERVILMSAARKSSDPLVAAAVAALGSLEALRDNLIETWKGQEDGSSV